jgi:hypothetical protein
MPPFNIPILWNQSDNLHTLNITSVCKIILAGQWNLRFNNISSVENDNNNTNNSNISDTQLQAQEFEANFTAVSKDGTGAHTPDIKL